MMDKDNGTQNWGEMPINNQQMGKLRKVKRFFPPTNCAYSYLISSVLSGNTPALALGLSLETCRKKIHQ